MISIEKLRDVAVMLADGEPLINSAGDRVWSGLVGRGDEGQLVVMVPLDVDDEGDGKWAVAEWRDQEARELLCALDAHQAGGGVA